MELRKKLEVLDDAAKYDAPRARSGVPKAGSRGIVGLDVCIGAGILQGLRRKAAACRR
ncbi:hypothetical protein [Paraburkholderia fynbosensis]|uniref:hypothetical protein n=1 Tax=Paraburkholderia fynbosensis TaxID=1200993 RepID=UPI001581830C|nr:hypothetical protein [Paraburkholderia fynbosensis]